MTGCCHNDHCSGESADLNSPAWRRALWIALVINAGMFAGELIAGIAAGSAALQADALDFLGDAGNYAISLSVAGMALVWRARAALVKGETLLLLGLWVLVNNRLACVGWHLAGGKRYERDRHSCASCQWRGCDDALPVPGR